MDEIVSFLSYKGIYAILKIGSDIFISSFSHSLSVRINLISGFFVIFSSNKNKKSDLWFRDATNT